MFSFQIGLSPYVQEQAGFLLYNFLHFAEQIRSNGKIFSVFWGFNIVFMKKGFCWGLNALWKPVSKLRTCFHWEKKGIFCSLLYACVNFESLSERHYVIESSHCVSTDLFWCSSHGILIMVWYIWSPGACFMGKHGSAGFVIVLGDLRGLF